MSVDESRSGFCVHCGHVVHRDDEFCGGCGAAIEAVAEATDVMPSDVVAETDTADPEVESATLATPVVSPPAPPSSPSASGEGVQSTAPTVPWHERSVVRIGALVAGVLGVAMLVMGVVAFLGSSDTSGEADALTARAEDVQSEADAAEAEAERAQAAAEELPGLTVDLETGIQSAIDALDATSSQYARYFACFDIDIADVQAFNVCIDNSFAAFNDALAAELEAASQLQQTVNEAEDAVNATTGGGTDEEEEGS